MIALDLRQRNEVPALWRADLEAHAIAALVRRGDDPLATVVQRAWDAWVASDEARAKRLRRSDAARMAAHGYLVEVVSALAHRRARPCERPRT